MSFLMKRTSHAGPLAGCRDGVTSVAATTDCGDRDRRHQASPSLYESVCSWDTCVLNIHTKGRPRHKLVLGHRMAEGAMSGRLACGAARPGLSTTGHASVAECSLQSRSRHLREMGEHRLVELRWAIALPVNDSQGAEETAV